MSGANPAITSTFGGSDGDREVAQDLAEAAHQICPYSKVTRGNIDVTINLVKAHCPCPSKPARSIRAGRMFWDQRRDRRGKAAFRIEARREVSARPGTDKRPPGAGRDQHSFGVTSIASPKRSRFSTFF